MLWLVIRLSSASYCLHHSAVKYRWRKPAAASIPSIRDEAIALNALLDADPSNAQIPIMANHVAAKLKQRSWYSTQECSFSFLSLGKMARAANKGNCFGRCKSGR